MLIVQLYLSVSGSLLPGLPRTSNMSRYFESNVSLSPRQTTCVSECGLNIGTILL